MASGGKEVAEGGGASVVGAGEESRARARPIRGFLFKTEPRAIGGPIKRKLWFALAEDTPFLFWYKSKNDVNPLGKIPLSGAAFTFDPRVSGVFEIHCGNKEVHILEAPGPQLRMQWLSCLQNSRKRFYNMDPSEKFVTSTESTFDGSVLTTNDLINLGDESFLDLSLNSSSSQDPSATPQAPAQGQDPGSAPSEAEATPTPEANISATSENLDDSRNLENTSKFYLSEAGELTPDSLVVPPAAEGTGEQFFEGLRSSTRRRSPSASAALTLDWRHEAMNLKARDSQADVKPRRLSFKLPSLNKPRVSSCDSCKELLSVIQTLKDRCFDIGDENNANKDLVNVLRQSLVSAKNQIDALKQISALSDFGDRIQYLLDKERQLTELQVKNAEYKGLIQGLRDKSSDLEKELGKANADLEAYKDSIRSKEELIMKLVSEDERRFVQTEISDDLIDIGYDLAESVTTPEVALSSSKQSRKELVFLPSETEVEDLGEVESLRDQVYGYQTQNAFLNSEILELQGVVRSLEAREKDLTRKNFNLEAMYYQLKSKYVLLLNHIRPSACGLDNSSSLSASEIEDLIKDATRSGEDISASNPEALIPDLPAVDGQSAPMATDRLGFYISDPFSSKNTTPRTDGDSRAEDGLDLVSAAAQYKKKSDEIEFQKKQEENEAHVQWLTKWDSTMVNLEAEKKLNPSQDLKLLVRTSIPHNYRTKVWRRIVDHWMRDTIDELGKGYYESLLKKSLARRESSYDASLKQIDLDLARTLPGNKYFEDTDSTKIEKLRKVLYAYRWHHPHIGYCQGLNRIAAVGLLYLEEADAFWFLVTCVDKHQPDGYYTPTLMTAVADQRVLKDLVSEKLPKVAAQLKQHETDLSLFTLSWFLTCFVDSLAHKVYLPIFDVFLYEGNKVLFRFALALLKICEPKILACKNSGTIHSCLSKIGEAVTDFKKLSHVAFNDLNPFPLKHIESRRQYHLGQLKNELGL